MLLLPTISDALSTCLLEDPSHGTQDAQPLLSFLRLELLGLALLQPAAAVASDRRGRVRVVLTPRATVTACAKGEGALAASRRLDLQCDGAALGGQFSGQTCLCSARFYRVPGSGFRVPGSGETLGSGFRLCADLGFRVPAGLAAEPRRGLNLSPTIHVFLRQRFKGLGSC